MLLGEMGEHLGLDLADRGRLWTSEARQVEDTAWWNALEGRERVWRHVSHATARAYVAPSRAGRFNIPSSHAVQGDESALHDGIATRACTGPSRIVGLPGNEDTIRGFSAVSLLLVDEASRVPDDLYLAVRPMLAVSGGALWLMSTPCGKRGFFWETWDRGGAGWEKVQLTAHGVQVESQRGLKEDRGTMREWRFKQEYLCEFTEAEDEFPRYSQIAVWWLKKLRPR